MNLKLKRLVRTSSSEQYALFDLDQIDEEDQLPLTIGKLDLHYTGEGVYGTILIWDESTRQLKAAQRRAFIHTLLEEISQPMGVPNEYVVEFFAPTLDHYEVFHNVQIGEMAGDDGELGDGELGEVDLGDEAGGGRGESAPAHAEAARGPVGGVSGSNGPAAKPS
ncbi:MAG TPA: hypothetical protein VNK95_22030 [Caldilineaceae bacterium]|nr:hypothetical protein [Caldilineaceae bacterium]